MLCLFDSNYLATLYAVITGMLTSSSAVCHSARQRNRAQVCTFALLRFAFYTLLQGLSHCQLSHFIISYFCTLYMPFQMQELVTGKALSLMADNCVRRTITGTVVTPSTPHPRLSSIPNVYLAMNGSMPNVSLLQRMSSSWR